MDAEYVSVAGIDEAGRGPLAGPVVAAAVILGPATLPGLDDSKKKTAAQRDSLFDAICSSARAYAVGLAEPAEIDELNIHVATLLAMRRALEALPEPPAEVLVDGKFCPETTIRARAIVGGDGLEPCISAASIIAKVTRDRMMLVLDDAWPNYGFARHKGYPTAAHLSALERFGVSPVHRRSFAPVRRLVSAGG